MVPILYNEICDNKQRLVLNQIIYPCLFVNRFAYLCPVSLWTIKNKTSNFEVILISRRAPGVTPGKEFFINPICPVISAIISSVCFVSIEMQVSINHSSFQQAIYSERNLNIHYLVSLGDSFNGIQSFQDNSMSDAKPK